MLLKGLDHSVYAGGRDAEETFDITLGWSLAVDCRVCIDERQVLALSVAPWSGVVICRGRRHEGEFH